MKILISNTSDTPLYQQIKDQITDAILKGELKEGELLPSIRSFANDLRVSVLTIRRVYDDLEEEGDVYKRQVIMSLGRIFLFKSSMTCMPACFASLILSE